jgi:parallel beta-helix repeat protein
MAALLVCDPNSPRASSVASITASGGGDYKNRLLLDDAVQIEVCSDTGFTASITVGSSTGTQTVKWQQFISGTWQLVYTLPITISASTTTPSGAFTITSSNTTVQDKSFSAPTSNGPQGARTIFIYAEGTAASPLNNITIRRCTFSGGTIAIWLRQVTNFTVEDCVIEDADYAGIDIWSGIGGTIQRNKVSRIGYSRTDFTDGAFLNNAYGILTNRNESSSLVTDPVSENVTITNNTVDWVPIWMGINTHGGKNHTFSNNTVSHCPRGIFMAGSPTGAGTTQCVNLTVTGNSIYAPVSKAGGTSDLEGILYASVSTISITNNGVQYNTPDPYAGGVIGSPGYFDYQNLSTGETISGNFLIP